jgi:uncharacterized protein
MKLSLDSTDAAYVIRAYGAGSVTVNARVVRRSVIVMPQQLVADWPPQRFEELEESHFEGLAALQPELVILGTGARQRFPHPRLTRALAARGIGVEVMDTAAACRTYNIVMAEGRRVAAALLLG